MEDNNLFKPLTTAQWKRVYNAIFDYPSQHDDGLTHYEINCIIDDVSKDHPFNRNRYEDAMMGVRYKTVQGQSVFRISDVVSAITCGLENRKLRVYEWN